jgi:NitT/TauT family transport system substrate-binding protein
VGRVALALALCGAFCAATKAHERLGEPGGPVELAVGYQPYWPPAWSGVVQRARGDYRRHLPTGSAVEFHVGLRGAVLVEGLANGTLDLIYVGDLPAVRIAADSMHGSRIVAALGASYDNCSILLVRSDTPPLPDPRSALRWLDGKRVGVPRGSCAERFALETFALGGVTPTEVVEHSILTLERSLMSRRIDAAYVWEPSATRLERLGLARRAVTGRDFGLVDTGFLVASGELIRRRPDVLRGWLEAELDAQLFLLDPERTSEVIEMVEAQTIGLDVEDVRHALYSSLPSGAARSEMTFDFDPARGLEIWKRLRGLPLAGVPIELDAADLVHADAARATLRSRGLTPPIGRIVPAPAGENRGQP